MEIENFWQGYEDIKYQMQVGYSGDTPKPLKAKGAKDKFCYNNKGHADLVTLVQVQKNTLQELSQYKLCMVF